MSEEKFKDNVLNVNQYNESELLQNEAAENNEDKSRPERGYFFDSLEQYGDQMEKLNWKGTFEEYFEKVVENPSIVRTAYEMTYQALTAKEDFFKEGKYALYGADKSISQFMEVMRAGALGLESSKRIILLAGPPGGGKSTLVNGVKHAIEQYSKTDEGATYAIEDCPMQEEPLHLIPEEAREGLLEEYGIKVEGGLCPACDDKYGDAYKKPEDLKNIPIKRIVLSESKGVGVGTFKPSDPKSQDITELVGHVDYSKLGEHGAVSDVKAYRFDGELHKANRGVMEFVEMLKSDEKFLYTLLDLTQDRVIKSPGFPNTHADEVIVAHTNMTEYARYTGDPRNEALKDRMIVIDAPYTLQVSEESKIHKKLIGEIADKHSVHISPETYDTISTFAVLSRMKSGKKFSKMQKLKVYDGRNAHDVSKKDLEEMRAEDPQEGMYGISPRFIIDSLSAAVAVEDKNGNRPSCINPLDAIKALKENLRNHPHTRDLSKEERQVIENDLADVWEEFNRKASADVKKAFVYSFEETARELSDNYLKNVEAYHNKDMLVDEDTGQEYEPDERLMRSIEERAKIAEASKSEFRKEILVRIGANARKGKVFDYRDFPVLKEAIEGKLFHDVKDVISLTTSTSVPNAEQKQRIYGVQKTMVEEQDYCQDCAHAIIQHVGRNLSKES